MPARLTTVDRQSVDYWQWAVMVVAPNQHVDKILYFSFLSFFFVYSNYQQELTTSIQ